MSIYSVPEFNKNTYSFDTVKADATYAGKMMMRNEIVQIIRSDNPKPTKAVQKILDRITEIELLPPYPMEER